VGDIDISDMQFEDIEAAGWSGGPTHLQYMRDALQRAQRGEVDFLAAWQHRQLVGIGGVDFGIDPAVGRLWMLAVRNDMQSRGIGTQLVAVMEDRVKQRNRPTVELLVEKQNVRAEQLYERLGYVVVRDETTSWEADAPDGKTFVYEADCHLMQKTLLLA
jgi:ribosomal protein S18 acetylase RimI-like enzyme